jgi:hypothetical protein
MELALVANPLFKVYHHPSDGLKVVIVLLESCGGDGEYDGNLVVTRSWQWY